MHTLKGFTLLELMIAVVVVSLLTAIALPSYQAYARKSTTSTAQQEMLRLAEQLERHRARNFTYKNFNPKFLYPNVTTDLTEVYVPGGVQTAQSKYKIELRDNSEAATKNLTANDALGYRWSMKAYPLDASDNHSYRLLLTSTGTKCMNTVTSRVSYTSCGTGAKEW